MTAAKGRWLIVSDLDGTLLNHHDYDVTAALPAIESCRARSIPVILNTSKTFAETLELREWLQLDSAFIVENGSCIYLPESARPCTDETSRRDGYHEIVCGRVQTEISAVLEQLQTPSSCYRRLSRCSVDEAVALTGLQPEQAGLAIAREFSEPLVWQGSDSELESFVSELQAHGLSTLQGGRFLHVIGDCDKGRAIDVLRECTGNVAGVVALGDSPNDAAMLAQADVAIIVSSPSSDKLAALQHADYVTAAPAPAGWAEAIDYIFESVTGEQG